MSHYDDSARWECAADGQRVTTIGWLDPARTHSTGEVRAGVFEKLVALLEDPWQPFASAGRHACPFCRFTGGPADVRCAGHTARVGSSLLFVPSVATVFVAPSLVVHYIDAHGYSPPADFQEAVLHCPPMRSLPYLAGLRAHGLAPA